MHSALTSRLHYVAIWGSFCFLAIGQFPCFVLTKTIQEMNAYSLPLPKNDQPIALEEVLSSMRTEQEKIQNSFYLCQRVISHILTALIAFSRHTPTALALSSSHPERPVRQAILLRHIVPILDKMGKEFVQNQEMLQETQCTGKEAEDILRDTALSPSYKHKKLQKLLNQKTSLYPSLKQTLERQMELLAEQVRSMDELIAELDAEISKIFKKNVTKEPSFQLPVEGKIRVAFGNPIPGTQEVSKGILFNTPKGAPIVAPASGRVVFSGAFRSYGKIVIIDHGNGLHSLVAGLNVLKVSVGEEITRGECLGLMTQNVQALLTFELRKNGKPVDPKGFLLKENKTT
ncbi:MAG: peptidoglycan DD-metalloendopeptidase family protein [Holosporales bacterium]|jgi:septal ring factor EnvC (AmiA/AmiB activator)|nr:peptidoglycan DD-metalloendopeptidase family protein [Holosporales bacterium]